MVTFDDLKRKVERELADEQSQQQINDSQSRSARLREHELHPSFEYWHKKRKLTEQSLWETPELAYQTWERRTRELVGYLDRLSVEFRQTASNARSRYKNQGFTVYAGTKGLLRIVGKRVPIGELTLSDLSLKFKYEHGECRHYFVLFEGNPLIVNESVLGDTSKQATEQHYGKVADLEKMIHEVFHAEAVADIIDNQQSRLFIPIIRFFREGGKLLERPSNYGWHSEYPETGTEDHYTLIWWGDISGINPIFSDQSVKVANPHFKEEIRRYLQNEIHFYIKHHDGPSSIDTRRNSW